MFCSCSFCSSIRPQLSHSVSIFPEVLTCSASLSNTKLCLIHTYTIIIHINLHKNNIGIFLLQILKENHNIITKLIVFIPWTLYFSHLGGRGVFSVVMVGPWDWYLFFAFGDGDGSGAGFLVGMFVGQYSQSFFLFVNIQQPPICWSLH